MAAECADKAWGLKVGFPIQTLDHGPIALGFSMGPDERTSREEMPM